MNWGYGMWAAMESMNAANWQALAEEAVQKLEEVAERYNRMSFVARSHVHGLRARILAHEALEEELIKALKAENANHPLASREAVDEWLDKKVMENLFDPEVIKHTYPDGKLPEGAVTPDGGVWTIK